MYVVKTDKEFAEKFQQLSMVIDQLSNIFQNGNQTLDIEIDRWNISALKAKKELSALIKESNERFSIKY